MTKQKKLREYQKNTIKELAKKPRCILGAEMGTGKTIMALMALEAHQYKKVLVVCPAVAVSHWYRESKEWGMKTELQVVSFDKARQPKILEDLKKWGHEAMVIDEAHYLKNAASKRTQAVYGERCDGVGGLVQGCKTVYALSGTICPNNISELYPHLRFMVPTRVMGDSYYFLTRYCSTLRTRWGTQITGARNTEELKTIMRHIYIPIRASKVLKDLPPISFSDKVIDPIDAKEAMLIVEELSQLPEIQALVHQLETCAELRDTPISDHVATLRKYIGIAKAAATAQYVLDIIEGSKEKVVVFGYHKLVLRHIVSLLLKSTGVVKIDGAVSPKNRDLAIERFRTDEKCKVFVGQLHACGTGITLNESRHVVFAEQDWTPSANLQAAKRCHRIGQKFPVFVHNLMLNNSIDERISAAISAKTQHLAEFGLCQKIS